MSDLTANARALLNNEAFKDAIEKTQQNYLKAAMACPLNDDEGRRLNISASRIVAEVASHLAALASDQTGEVIEIPAFYEERAKRRFAFLTR